MVYEIVVNGKGHRLELSREADGWLCRCNGGTVQVDAVMPRPGVLSLLVAGRSYEIKREQTASEVHLWIGSTRFSVEIRDPRGLRSRQAIVGKVRGPQKILAPMPGRIVRVLVAEGAAVEAGQGIAVVEAMKMQNEIKSPGKGIVRRITAVAGAAVNPGDVLGIVE
jgi:biotin carboxyl carrier protein